MGLPRGHPRPAAALPLQRADPTHSMTRQRIQDTMARPGLKARAVPGGRVGAGSPWSPQIPPKSPRTPREKIQKLESCSNGAAQARSGPHRPLLKGQHNLLKGQCR